MKTLIAGAMALALAAGPALAVEKKAVDGQLPVAEARASEPEKGLPIPLPFDPLNLNGNGGKSISIDQMIDKVRAWVLADAVPDLSLALKLGAAASPPDTMTAACFTPILAFANQIATLPTADQMPKIHLAVDIEIGTDLIVAFQPNSPLMTGCASLANFQKLTLLNMVTGITTGAATLAALK
jgi:hypothetical protein